IEKGFEEMSRNVFDRTDEDNPKGATLSHSQIQTIMKDAERFGSLEQSVLKHAAEYGIEDIDLLFPDAKAVANTPEFNSRRMEWVSEVLNGVKHSPFSRIKSFIVDITAAEARAKGYVTGSEKIEEVIVALRRKTDPTTIYKKQKLDRDHILDITDFDVIA